MHLLRFCFWSHHCCFYFLDLRTNTTFEHGVLISLQHFALTTLSIMAAYWSNYVLEFWRTLLTVFVIVAQFYSIFTQESRFSPISTNTVCILGFLVLVILMGYVLWSWHVLQWWLAMLNISLHARCHLSIIFEETPFVHFKSGLFDCYCFIYAFLS